MRRLLPVLVTGLFCAAVSMRATLADSTTTPMRASAALLARPASPRVAGTPGAPMDVSQQNDAIKKFCRDCHNDGDMVGDFSLDHFDAAKTADHEIGRAHV